MIGVGDPARHVASRQWLWQRGSRPLSPSPLFPFLFIYFICFFFFVFLFVCLFVKGGLDWAWAQSDGIACYRNP
jgi:hypothetical protein